MNLRRARFQRLNLSSNPNFHYIEKKTSIYFSVKSENLWNFQGLVGWSQNFRFQLTEIFLVGWRVKRISGHHERQRHNPLATVEEFYNRKEGSVNSFEWEMRKISWKNCAKPSEFLADVSDFLLQLIRLT